MEGVAELMEERLQLVEVEQGGLVARGLGEVEHQGDHRDDVLPVAVVVLLAEVGHPGAAPLGGTREEVHIHHGNHLVVVDDLIHLHILLIDGNLLVLAEGQAIQFVADHKEALAGGVEREVGADFLFVEVVFLLSEFLTIVAPVIRLKFEATALLVNHLLVEGSLLLGLGQCRGPHMVEQLIDIVGVLGHTILQYEVGIAVITHDVGAFQTQVHNLVDKALVVELAPEAAGGIGGPYLLAELAVLAVHQEGLQRGHIKGEHVLALGVGIGVSGFLGGHQLLFGETVQFVHIVHNQLIAVGGFEHIIAEFLGQCSQFGVDFAETFLLVCRHVGTPAHETLVGLLQQAQLLVIELLLILVLIHLLDALEQFGIKHNVIAMLRIERHDGVGQLLHLLVVAAFQQIEKHGGHLVEQFVAVFQRDDCIAKSRLLFIGDDGIYSLLLLPHALLEGRQVVFSLDFVEWRHAVRGVPLFHKRIVEKHLIVVFLFAAAKQYSGGNYQRHNANIVFHIVMD